MTILGSNTGLNHYTDHTLTFYPTLHLPPNYSNIGRTNTCNNYYINLTFLSKNKLIDPKVITQELSPRVYALLLGSRIKTDGFQILKYIFLD